MISDGTLARQGWAALLGLLQLKGLITEDEARAVVAKAQAGAEQAHRMGLVDKGGANHPQPAD